MGRRVLAIFAAAVIALIGVASVLLYVRGCRRTGGLGAAAELGLRHRRRSCPPATTLKDAIREGCSVKTTVAAKGAAGGCADPGQRHQQLPARPDRHRPGSTSSSPGSAPRRSAPRPSRCRPAWSPSRSQLTDPARVGTFVTPGTHIAIFDSYKIKAIGDDAKSKALNEADVNGTSVLLEDVLVIAHGRRSAQPRRTGAPTPRRGQGCSRATPAPELPGHRRRHADRRRPADPRHQQRHAVCRPARRRPEDGHRRPVVDDLNLFDLSGAAEMTLLWDTDPGSPGALQLRGRRGHRPGRQLGRAAHAPAGRPRRAPGRHRPRRRHAGGLRPQRARAGSSAPRWASSCCAVGSTSPCWPRPCAPACARSSQPTT